MGLIKHLFPHWALSISIITAERWLNVLVRNTACLDSYAITGCMSGRVINWEIHDSFSIWNTWEDSQSSFTCPLWLMHLHPIYNMYDHTAGTHNIESYIMYWGCLNMMMAKAAIRISHPATTTSFHCEWLGLQRAEPECSRSQMWLHWQALTPANTSDLTQLFSIVFSLCADSIWGRKKKNTLSTHHLLYFGVFSWQVASGGHANNDCLLFEFIAKKAKNLHRFPTNSIGFS